MTNKEEVQKKYLMLQELQQQQKVLEQQLLLVNQQVLELATMLNNLKDIEHIGAERDSLVALHSGIFVESKLGETKHLLVNVGAGVLVRKTVAETRDMLTRQLEDSKELHKKIASGLQQVVGQMVELQRELQRLVSEKAKV